MRKRLRDMVSATENDTFLRCGRIGKFFLQLKSKYEDGKTSKELLFIFGKESCFKKSTESRNQPDVMESWTFKQLSSMGRIPEGLL